MARRNLFIWTIWGADGSNSDSYGDLVFVEDSSDLGAITGAVITEEKRTPYAELVVQAYRGDQAIESAWTDSAGQYRLRLPPGEYTLKPGRGQGVERFEQTGVTVQSGQESRSDFSVSPVPILARLSFWLAPERLRAFEAVYEQEVVPLLQKHQWIASSERGRTTTDSVFSRLFEFKSTELDKRWMAVLADSAFQTVLQDLGTTFGTTRADGFLENDFRLYAAPSGSARTKQSGPGKVVQGGPGKVVPALRGTGSWRTYDVTDGLGGAYVSTIMQDRTGALWFGTGAPGALGRGISRYDGQTWTTFTEEDGLADNEAWWVLEDQKGGLWIGTWGGGVSRYDGQTWTTFTKKDGLVNNYVWSIFQDREDNLWFGTYGGGVSRYDGESWTTITEEDGLVHNNVHKVFQDRQGVFWFSTEGGVSRYDGQTWTSFTTVNGLIDNNAWAIIQDRQGVLWFATEGGVSRYDGQTFQTLTRKDGLGSNVVLGITLDDQTGMVWVATGGGVTRFRPPAPVPPPAVIEAVVADKRYAGVAELSIPSTVALTAFEFVGYSFKTRPGALIYRYRLEGYDDWQTTRQHRVEYEDLPIGSYTFEIQAVDRDLAYSEKVASVRVIVHPPYGVIALWSSLGLALLGFIIALGYGIKRQRERNRAREERLALQEQLNRELEDELNTAHEMQMGLMPKEAPQFANFQLAGRCIPATHVGGDFFQYFDLVDNRLSISLADVTGHAMAAAVPVMMFSGILKSQMELGEPVDALFERLNRILHETLDRRTFICFTMAELDLTTRGLHLATCGSPYPIHFQAAQDRVVEVQLDAYPLGVRPDTAYQALKIQLEPGDRVVFCSDGIIEALDTAEQMFGFEQTAETVLQGCREDLSAEALLERILEEVKAFAGEMPQGDDQTIVVLQVAK